MTIDLIESRLAEQLTAAGIDPAPYLPVVAKVLARVATIADEPFSPATAAALRVSAMTAMATADNWQLLTNGPNATLGSALLIEFIKVVAKHMEDLLTYLDTMDVGSSYLGHIKIASQVQDLLHGEIYFLLFDATDVVEEELGQTVLQAFAANPMRFLIQPIWLTEEEFFALEAEQA